MNGAYYNELDPFAAAWLRGLIADGLIAPGDVDERDIQVVQPGDLAGYAQCHFFAGIGGWSLALRLAGWDDSRPVWTGSCPCQPFSSAGKGEGFNDPRHLWPTWFRLIRECRPPVVFGEQVASKDGLAWFDTVSTDLEAEAYAIGAADLCAAGVTAPHIRQRLWWVADATGPRSAWRTERAGNGRAQGTEGSAWHLVGRGEPEREGAPAHGLEHTDGERRDGQRLHVRPWRPQQDQVEATGRGEIAVALADSERERLEGQQQGRPAARPTERSGGSPWADIRWLPCRDGKARPTKPGLFPLAHGVPNRVGTLRGAGNAIVPQVATEFVSAWLEARMTVEAL